MLLRSGDCLTAASVFSVRKEKFPVRSRKVVVGKSLWML